MDDRTSGGAQEHMGAIKKAYQMLITEGKVRKVCVEEEVDWIVPSKPIIYLEYFREDTKERIDKVLHMWR